MRHMLPLAPQFYVTAPQPCPYLERRMERKLFTALDGEEAVALNDALSRQGFRRSQNVVYRPLCADCCACMSARIRVDDFKMASWQKRILKKNAHLSRRSSTPWATEHHYNLFRSYLEARHKEGGMADMDAFEFASMVEETPIRTRLVEFYDPSRKHDDRHGLTATCLTDILDDGLSLVYSFYDPERDEASLGSYVILQHVLLAQELGLPYVYLGYWVKGSPKMGYKARFKPLEVYTAGRWQELDDPDTFQASPHPLDMRSVVEQVSALSLPSKE